MDWKLFFDGFFIGIIVVLVLNFLRILFINWLENKIYKTKYYSLISEINNLKEEKEKEE